MPAGGTFLIVTGTPFTATLNDTTNTFNISGNYTNMFNPGAVLTIRGGPPNGGYQQVTSSVFTGGNTVVTVSSYTTGTAYPGPATFTGNVTVNLIWFYSGTSQVATPTFSPSAGTFGSTQSVTISCSTPSSTIYYTEDGSTPTTSSAVYSGAISVRTTQTIKAIATASGYSTSAVGSAAYVISSGSPDVVGISPGDVAHTTDEWIAMSSDGTYKTSTDGETFTAGGSIGSAMGSATITSVAVTPVGPNYNVVAVGTNGTIVTSSDGTTWSAVTGITSNDLTGIFACLN